MHPKVTVVTISFNSEANMEHVIQSVRNQSYPNIEYVVIDGASTDSTLSIIEKYETDIDFFVSEPDGGIADAMNKGIENATGDYLLFLHSDDYFHKNDSLERCMRDIRTNADAHIYTCDVLYGTKFERKSARKFGFWTNFKTRVMHQGVLCHRSVFDRIGDFDTEFALAMDFEFFLRAYKYGYQITKVPKILSVMRDTGVGSRRDRNSLTQRFSEERKAHLKNNKTTFFCLLYLLYWPLYLTYRRMLFIIGGQSK